MKQIMRYLSRLAFFASAVFLVASIPVMAHGTNDSLRAPREILSGWIPYYSVKTVLPFVKKIPSLTRDETATAGICDTSQYGSAENDSLTASYLFRNSDLIKEVMPFWFTLKSKAVIRNDYVSGNPSWPMATTTCLIKRAGISVIPTITDGTAKLELSTSLANVTTRTQIIESISNLVMNNGFDGIDLDFEGFAFVDGSATWPKTMPNWITFIKELSIKLHANQKLLSVTTPVLFDPTQKSKGYTVYAWAAIANDIDRLRIMTYDYSVDQPGPIGPITWVQRTLNYAITVMPSSKVYVGLPGYGRDWITGIVGICPTSAPPGTSLSAKAATFKTNYAQAKALVDQATPTFDTKTAEATYSYTKVFNGQGKNNLATSCTVTRTVWYQNSDSYAQRAALVSQYKLGGVALWTLGIEDDTATQEIRKAATSFAPEKITIVLSLDKNTIRYGDSFLLTGNVTGEDKSGKSGLAVIVEYRKSEQSPWRHLADLVTGSDGSISLPLTFGTRTYLQLRTEGTWDRANSMSDEAIIDVAPSISVVAPTTVSLGKATQITGTIFPQSPGSTAQLQKLVLGKWQDIAVVLATADDGKFVLPYTESKRGVATYRVLYFLQGETIENKSTEFSVVVK
jgi:spore germination protein YaaH